MTTDNFAWFLSYFRIPYSEDIFKNLKNINQSVEESSKQKLFQTGLYLLDRLSKLFQSTDFGMIVIMSKFLTTFKVE